MFKIQTIQRQDEWNRVLVSLTGAHALQSWEWGEFKSRWGWEAQRLLWVNEKPGASPLPVAAAQVLHRPIPHTPWSFLYVSKGPILDCTDPTLANQVLADLESTARRAGALFIKIDPDVPRHYGETQPDQPIERPGQVMLDLLARRGWHFSPEQIQFRNTILINLTPSPEAMLEAMKSKWRYNIRLAERKGVTIRSGGSEDIPLFYQMYVATAARDGFLIRPEAYYYDIWQKFLTAGRAEILLASVEGEVVAGLILFIFGTTSWYMYGASTGRRRETMPNHLLQWAAICQAKNRGCLTYDMWGAPDVFDETDRLWGVYRFKSGFGGQVMQGLGAFDYPVNRLMYWGFTVALPRVRSFLRRSDILETG